MWNSVDKYTQTWSGGVWSPADSETVYNITASTTSCRFRCYAASFRIEDQCVAGALHKGLYWSPRSTSTMTWSNAISYCTGLGGRLPNIQELRMLIKECPKNEYPKPDGQAPWCTKEDPGDLGGSSCSGCTSDSSGKYSVFGDNVVLWSSSSYVSNANYAWYVGFYHGSVNIYDKTDYFYARCVR